MFGTGTINKSGVAGHEGMAISMGDGSKLYAITNLIYGLAWVDHICSYIDDKSNLYATAYCIRHYLDFSSIFVDVEAKVTGLVGWSLTIKLSTSGLA